MKLISLNTWGGKALEPLLNFIAENEKDTDVLCFQEITFNTAGEKEISGYRANLLNDLTKTLPEFNYYYTPWLRGFDPKGKDVDYDLQEGIAIFIKKEYQLVENDENLLINKKFPRVKKDFSNMPSILQRVTIDFKGQALHIFTTHGVSFPGSKLDTPDRIKQSEGIIEIMDKFEGPKILCGDFNLMPDTESINMLGDVSRNLIKEFNIQNTRSRLNPYFNKPDRQFFADYTFVSEDIKVKSFAVPDIAISDHLPMILEFDV